MTVPAAVAKAPGRSTGAPPANEVTWDRINWDQVAQEVARLQVRIAK